MTPVLLPLVIFGLCGSPMLARVLSPPDLDVAEVCLYVDGAVFGCTAAGPDDIVTFVLPAPACGQDWYATAKDGAGNESERSKDTAHGLCVDMDCDDSFSNRDLMALWWHGLMGR